MKKLHWYNCCNHGNDHERTIANKITDVTCKTCLRKINELGLVDHSSFDLTAVPLEKHYCPICGHREEHNFNGHYLSNHHNCPVRGFDVKYNK